MIQGDPRYVPEVKLDPPSPPATVECQDCDGRGIVRGAAMLIDALKVACQFPDPEMENTLKPKFGKLVVTVMQRADTLGIECRECEGRGRVRP